MWALTEIGDWISWGELTLCQDPYDYDGVWVTADNRFIKFEELEDVHLANIVGMLIRYNTAQYWPNLIEYWESRVAQQCADFNLEGAVG